LALRNTARHGNHFRCNALLFKARGFFDGNFVKGVHGHFDISNIHSALIGLHAYFDVVINHTLDRYQYLHRASSRGSIKKPYTKSFLFYNFASALMWASALRPSADRLYPPSRKLTTRPPAVSSASATICSVIQA